MDYTSKPIVIIESRYAGDVKRNEIYARRCMRDSFNRGEVPFVSHLLYTQVLDDTNPVERKLGMEAGFAFYSKSDYSAIYDDYGLSGGMKAGIEVAEKLGHRIEYRQIGTNENPT
jgi:hypothetical protein